MKKTLNVAVAAMLALAATANSGGSGPPEMIMDNCSVQNSTVAAKEAPSWTLVIAPIKNDLCLKSDALRDLPLPDFGYSHWLTPMPFDMDFTENLATNPDVGWTMTATTFYTQYIDQESGQSASNVNFSSSLSAQEVDTGQSESSPTGNGIDSGDKVSIVSVPCPHWVQVKDRAWC